MCSITDIEDLVSARNEVRERKDRMSALLDEAQVVLLAVDPSDYRITFFEGSVNTALVSREATLNKSLQEVWPESGMAEELAKLLSEEKHVVSCPIWPLAIC